MDYSFLHTIKPHVVFATPCYGGQLSEAFFRSFFQMQNLFHRLDLPMTLRTIANESLITRARNVLTANFMADPAGTHLMFIDADIEFPAEGVLKLLKHDLDIVAGSYPTKGINWEAVRDASPSTPTENLQQAGTRYALNRHSKQEVRGDLVEVQETATGFLLIRRSVFERMFKEYPQLRLNPCEHLSGAKSASYYYSLFDTCVDDQHNYLSEDYTFCQRWTNIGGRIWVDRTILLNHIGSYAFKGNIEKLARL